MTWVAAPSVKWGLSLSKALCHLDLPHDESPFRDSTAANGRVPRDPTLPDRPGWGCSVLQHAQASLVVNRPYWWAQGPLQMLIESTGIKVECEGEWNASKHGGAKRRVWCKIHFGIAEKTLRIRVVEVTSSDVSYAPILPELLDGSGLQPRGREVPGA